MLHQSLRDNFSRCRRNVTIAANTPTELTRLPIPSVSQIRPQELMAHQLYTATVTVNVVGQIIAANDTLGTPAAPLASGTTVAAV
jgi:hypothetical protein